MNPMKIRSLFESRSRETNGRLRFVNEMRQGLGLCDARGNDHKDFAGNRLLKDRKWMPEQMSLQELAEGIIGPSWRTLFAPDSNALSRYLTVRGVMESRFGGDARALLENVGVGIDPTAFLNINAFSSVVGGLIEVKILESFQNPSLIGDKLAPAMPTKLNGQKLIGVNRIGDLAKQRQPGEPHPRAQFNERWVQTPETSEFALAVEVTKEAVFFDLTGQLLQNAALVGEEIAYRKELRVIDAFIGVTNTFNYNGSAYNTFVTSRTLGYLNDHSNPLNDWTAIQAAMLLSQRQQDPYTSKRILVKPDTVVVNPAKVATAALILAATQTERRTGSGSPAQTGSNPLNVSVSPGAPYTGIDQLSSPLIEQRCTASDGLNLSQANADEYWWAFEKGKFMQYMQNYPLSVSQAAPNTYEMLDRGIVAAYFANERGVPAIVSPWHVIRNKN